MKPALESTTDPEKWVKNKLLIITAIVSFIGIITGAVESISKFIVIAESNFYLLVSLLWLAFIIVITQLHFGKVKFFTMKPNTIKMAIIIVATTLFLFSIIWKYYELHIRKTKPAEQPLIFLSLIKNAAYPVILASIHHPTQSPRFTIENIQINEEMCSFTESMESTFSSSRRIRTFTFNNQLTDAFKNGQCFGVQGDEPALKVLPILRERLDKIGKSNLKLYIPSVDGLSRIIRERGDIFQQVMFSSSELQSLKQSNPAQYEVVKDWILNCIGVKQPVIMFTLLNKTNNDLLINKVAYIVSETGQVKGGESGPLYPLITYNHVLQHKKGIQNKNLNPVLLLKAKDRVTFNIRLISASQESGLTWVMKVRLYDSVNSFSETESFQLIMSK